MPKVLPEYLELRKQQVLDAAAACFTRTGFHQTTMADICGEAELSPGAVYRYFRSKEEIIQAMCLRFHDEDADTIRNAMDLGSGFDALTELVGVYFEGAESHELCALSIELIVESRRDPVILASLRDGLTKIHGPLAELIRNAQKRGEVRSDVDPDAMGRILLGLYQGLICQRIVDPEMDISAYAAGVRALVSGLFGMAPADVGERAPATSLRH